MNKSITESQFYMWRTLFAVAHIDDKVTDEEIRFMMEALEDIPFTMEQKDVLKDDIYAAKDVIEMFRKITDDRDQAAFFKLAGELVWIDGDYGEKEREIILQLQREHIRNVNMDNLVGNVDLSLESDEDGTAYFSVEEDTMSIKDSMSAFRRRFLGNRSKRK